MPNSIERYTGTDPNGDNGAMSKVTVTTAGLMSLAQMPKADSYTLRLWIKAAASRTVTVYIGSTPFTMAVTTAWKTFKFTADATANSSCDLYFPAGTYYIWHPMLERSTKASDYRQAPEDVQKSIDTAAENAVSTANDYTNYVLQEYVTIEDMHSEIRQTQEEISMSVNKQTSRSMTYAEVQANNALTAANNATDTKLLNYVTTTRYSSDFQILSNQISSAVTATETLATYVDGDFYTQITNEYSAAITQTASGIESRVAQTYATVTTVNGLSTRMTTAETSITQNANAIALRVIKGDRTVSGSTVNDTISEINASAKGISLTTAGRLTITAGNFKLDGSGNATMTNATLTGGTIKTSNYTAATSSAKTVGAKINLAATGSTLLFDTANFKITGAGAVTATSATLNSCTISGGTFKVATATQTGQNTSYIELKNTYTYGSSSETWTFNAKPSGMYLKYTATGYYQQVDIGYSSISVTENGDGTYIVPDAITTASVYLDTLRLNNVSGIALQAKSWSSYGTTCMVGISEIPLRLCGSTVHTTSDLNFTTAGTGLMFNGVWAYRVYNSEMALGADSKNMRFYAKKVYFNCPAYTDGGALVTSDRRKKNNIKPLDKRYIDVLKNLQPVSFRYNNRNDGAHAGFIAQDVMQAISKANIKPEEFAVVADCNGDGSEYALGYDEFAALLLLYIKDLEKQIVDLRRNVS